MTERLIDTAAGPARVVRHATKGARAHLVLTHGAGGGIDAIDLVALASQLPNRGITVSRVELPWRVAGKKFAPPPPRIDEAYREVLGQLRFSAPLVLSGRSAGARSACRIGSSVGASAVVALAFPLHPPGRPEKSRAAEALGVGLPLLVVQGERDSFGTPAEFPAGLQVHVVPDGDHSLKVRKSAPVSQDEALGEMCDVVADWILGGNL